MLKIFELIGRYFILMGKVFSRPEKRAIYRRRIIYEMESLGLNSIGLTAIISVFIGAVITLQMSINLESPFIPKYIIGYATRETMILEFSSTVVALILAGKVGSSIASEIGTMRITEQIDVPGNHGCQFGVVPDPAEDRRNRAFLPLPGDPEYPDRYCRRLPDFSADGHHDSRRLRAGPAIRLPTLLDHLHTYQDGRFRLSSSPRFRPYYGYYAKGNSLEVGAASYQAVVASSIVIMIFNLILTQILLT